MRFPSFANSARYISIAVFLVSLALPCFDADHKAGENGEGIALLISGCFGFFSSLTGLIWLANPALLISWINIDKKPDTALLAAVTSTIIALLFLCCNTIIINEAGKEAYIDGYRAGYWVWLTSIAIMLFASIYVSYKRYNRPVPA